MKAAYVPFLAIALSGCAWFGPQDDAQPGTLQFEKGVTTQSEIFARLGQPNETRWLPDGTVVDIYRFVPTGDASARMRVMTITFDSSGKLLSYSNPDN
jgi:hypothetical protein